MITIPIAATTVVVAGRLEPDEIVGRLQALTPAHLFLFGFLPVSAFTMYLISRPRKVYLIDYACFHGTHHYRIPIATFVEHTRQMPTFNEKSIRFMSRLLESSGLGDETCAPAPTHYIPAHEYCTLEAAREEAELVVFSAMDELFSKTNVSLDTIDILVVNCSCFNPTPSFTDMIVNKYKLRGDIRSVHLSGMGCSAGLISVELARNLLRVSPQGARRTLKTNITAIAPIVLPISEQLFFAMSFVAQKLSSGRVRLYVPNFLTAFEHFCIHAGGSAVIDEVQRSLGLSDKHVEPSRMTLHRFGNISSSSVWYELAYIEAKGRMHEGDRIWLIGFGSGFKCNSAVWECIVPAPNSNGPWAGCIHRYPVQIKSPKARPRQ
ncbi:unnamed protein product [Triticum turgidum subsp. durum]|uniref:very-long-chain 3-oxoacyl-CoA synthase n=1 Tax=Triticum turgidum subsp. durum TaxID=4567 RepID=A0A9R0RYB6_TRITD|nr:unnamed protein product [Triticum turgidum subsp. durum]